MIGQGYWKDFYSQEYIEDLIRLTFPGAKVNDINAFHHRGPIAVNANTVYFCQVNIGLSVAGGAPGANPYIFKLGDQPWLAIVERSDFILFDGISELVSPMYENTTCVVVGYKITLDNEITDIYANEDPPVFNQLDGVISDPVLFASLGSLNDDDDIPKLQVAAVGSATVIKIRNIAGQGATTDDVDEFEVLEPDHKFLAVYRYLSDMTVPKIVTLRALRADNSVCSDGDTLVMVSGDIRHYDYGGIRFFHPGVNQLILNNCENITCDIRHFGGDGVTLKGEYNTSIGQVGFDGTLLQNLLPMAAVGDFVFIKPTFRGVVCGWSFLHMVESV